MGKAGSTGSAGVGCPRCSRAVSLGDDRSAATSPRCGQRGTGNRVQSQPSEPTRCPATAQLQPGGGSFKVYRAKSTARRVPGKWRCLSCPKNKAAPAPRGSVGQLPLQQQRESFRVWCQEEKNSANGSWGRAAGGWEMDEEFFCTSHPTTQGPESLRRSAEIPRLQAKPPQSHPNTRLPQAPLLPAALIFRQQLLRSPQTTFRGAGRWFHPAADLAAAPAHPCGDPSGPHFPKSLVILGAFISDCPQERPGVQTGLSASSLEIWQLYQPAEPFLTGSSSSSSSSIPGAPSKSCFAKLSAVLGQEHWRGRGGQGDSGIIVPRVMVSDGRCSARYGGLSSSPATPHRGEQPTGSSSDKVIPVSGKER